MDICVQCYASTVLTDAGGTPRSDQRRCVFLCVHCFGDNVGTSVRVLLGVPGLRLNLASILRPVWSRFASCTFLDWNCRRAVAYIDNSISPDMSANAAVRFTMWPSMRMQ